MPLVHDNQTGNGFSKVAYAVVSFDAAGNMRGRSFPEIGPDALVEADRLARQANAHNLHLPPSGRFSFQVKAYDCSASARAASDAIAKAMRRPPLLGYDPK